MKVEFRESFVKDLDGRDTAILLRLRKVIERLELADSLLSIPNIKRMKGGNAYFRIRVGDYRLGLKLDEQQVIVIRFLHRKEIYRYFP